MFFSDSEGGFECNLHLTDSAEAFDGRLLAVILASARGDSLEKPFKIGSRPTKFLLRPNGTIQCFCIAVPNQHIKDNELG